jgi:hypothetical protein
MIKIFYFAIYLLIWIYVLPKVDTEYQFLLKVLLISLPFIFGYQQIQEIEEKFLDKSKIIGQLVDVPNKSSIALVYNDGTISFLDDINSKKYQSNKSKKNISKKNNKNSKSSSKKNFNWYNSLSK